MSVPTPNENLNEAKKSLDETNASINTNLKSFLDSNLKVDKLDQIHFTYKLHLEGQERLIENKQKKKTAMMDSSSENIPFDRLKEDIKQTKETLMGHVAELKGILNDNIVLTDEVTKLKIAYRVQAIHNTLQQMKLLTEISEIKFKATGFTNRQTLDDNQKIQIGEALLYDPKDNQKYIEEVNKVLKSTDELIHPAKKVTNMFSDIAKTVGTSSQSNLKTSSSNLWTDIVNWVKSAVKAIGDFFSSLGQKDKTVKSQDTTQGAADLKQPGKDQMGTNKQKGNKPPPVKNVHTPTYKGIAAKGGTLENIGGSFEANAKKLPGAGQSGQTQSTKKQTPNR